MADVLRGLDPVTPHRSMRGFQALSHRDLPKLETFFLAFDFAQRRTYFGGGTSDASIRDYCRKIRFSETTIIVRNASPGFEAIAMLTAARPRVAELSIACATARNRSATTADLLDLALTVASLSYSDLVVRRERASPELLALLRCAPSAVIEDDTIRIDVSACDARIVAC